MVRFKVSFFLHRQALQCTTQPNYCPDPSPLLELGARFETTQLEVAVGKFGKVGWFGGFPRDHFKIGSNFFGGKNDS